MASIDWATHVLQGGIQRVAKVKTLASPQTPPKFGLRIATHAHEAETVSNRTSECYGEEPPNSAHTAHHARRVCETRWFFFGQEPKREWTVSRII